MTAIEPTTQSKSNSGWLFLLALMAGFVISWVALPTIMPQLSLGWLATSQAAWYLTRASGTIGYLLLASSTIWGLLLSSKLIKQAIPPPVSLAMHNYLSWAAIGLSALHAILLLFDNYYKFTIAHLLIPFIGPFSPFWVGLGIIGFYVMAVTTGSFYFRKQIGQKRWRKLHYLTFVAFILITMHGWTAGTDHIQLAAMYLVSGASVFFLTIYRMLTAVTQK